MTVHRDGPIKVGAGDFYTVHRGALVAIKTLDWGSGPPVIGLCERIDGEWINQAVIVQLDDRNDGQVGYYFEMEAEAMGGLAEWIATRLVPKINAALAERFKPTGDAPPPPPASPVDALDAVMVSALRWRPQADGTLRVEAV